MMRREVTYMDKLKITVVSEEAIMESMEGCGKNHPQLCGAKQCSFNGTSRED